MKKILSVVLATVFLLASVSVFAAEVPDVTAAWTNTIHVSFDEIKPGIVCGGDFNKINYYSAASGTTDVTFWGWATSDVDFVGFSYSINGGEKVTDASFKHDTEQAVKDAGAGAYDSRFDVKAIVSEGSQLVRVYADYADGTSEAIWACEVTVGAASDYTDNEGSAPSTPSTPSNPETGDAMIVAIVAVATIALAGVVVSKKIHA